MEVVAGSRFFTLRERMEWTSIRSRIPRLNLAALQHAYDGGAPPSFTQTMHLHSKRSAIQSRTLSSQPITMGSVSISTDVPIMVNDCSGKMGRAVAEAAVEAGLQLVPFCLTGPGFGQSVLNIKDVEVHVHEASEKEVILNKVLEKYPGVIIADYTLPTAVNENAEFYSRRGVPFVMGTTGGDRKKLLKSVSDSGVYTVIAPQMGKQVVAFQAAMEIMAEQFPGAFAGYKLEVTESHQSSKVDTSGTARAVVASFNKLGLSFKDEEIKMVRNPEEQITKMGVPEEHLKGHAFHTYSLTSPDGMVSFQFQHNVCGRSIYAQGTVDAVLFLAQKVQEKAEKKIYDMVDVLRGGNMR